MFQITLVCVLLILTKICDADLLERFDLSYNVTSTDGLDPVIQISCTFVPPPGSGDVIFGWFRHSNMILAERGKLADEVSAARFTLNVTDNNTEVFSIRNALKEDANDYHCATVY